MMRGRRVENDYPSNVIVEDVFVDAVCVTCLRERPCRCRWVGASHLHDEAAHVVCKVRGSARVRVRPGPKICDECAVARGVKLTPAAQPAASAPETFHLEGD